VSRTDDVDGFGWQYREGAREAPGPLEESEDEEHRQGPEDASPDALGVAADPGQEENRTDQPIPEDGEMGPESRSCADGKVIEEAEEGRIEASHLHPE
jgi:hypothetical protein